MNVHSKRLSPSALSPIALLLFRSLPSFQPPWLWNLSSIRLWFPSTFSLSPPFAASSRRTIVEILLCENSECNEAGSWTALPHLLNPHHGPWRERTGGRSQRLGFRPDADRWTPDIQHPIRPALPVWGHLLWVWNPERRPWSGRPWSGSWRH